MRIEVWSDVVCPWCYVGDARLRSALAKFEHAGDVEVVYRSFELDPTFPDADVEPARRMLMRRYGMSAEQAAAADSRVAELAAAEGLPFSAEHLVGNTFDVHRVLQLGRERGRQDELLERVFRASFGAATSIFDADALVALAIQAGIEGAAARRVLDSDEYADAVRNDEREARELGISGVPFFLFDDRLYVAGAQPVEVMRRALRQAWESKPAA